MTTLSLRFQYNTVASDLHESVTSCVLFRQFNFVVQWQRFLSTRRRPHILQAENLGLFDIILYNHHITHTHHLTIRVVWYSIRVVLCVVYI